MESDRDAWVNTTTMYRIDAPKPSLEELTVLVHKIRQKHPNKELYLEVHSGKIHIVVGR